MKVDILSPEKNIFTGEASAVSLPGVDGVFQVLNNHAPIISSLKKGDVVLSGVSETQENNENIEKLPNNQVKITINGGMVELTNNKLIVLAN
jgi:F-type H+-transporting ATPase subunit epsilon